MSLSQNKLKCIFHPNDVHAAKSNRPSQILHVFFSCGHLFTLSERKCIYLIIFEEEKNQRKNPLS